MNVLDFINNLTIRAKVNGLIVIVITIANIIFMLQGYFDVKDTLYASQKIKAQSILEAGHFAMEQALKTQQHRDATLLHLRTLTSELATTSDKKAREKLISQSEYFKTLPVRVGLAIAQQAGASDGYQISYQQINARFKNEEASPQIQQAIGLAQETQQPFSFFIDWETNMVTAFYAIKTEPGHLVHYGTLSDDPDGNGYDQLGYKMEGWRVGEYHSGYLLQRDLSELFNSEINNILLFNAMVFIIVNLFAVGLGILIAKTITHALKAPITSANAISEGDLSQNVDPANDETKQLRNALSVMTQNLRHLIQNITDSAEQQTSASDQLSSISEQTYQNISNQQSNTEQVATAISQLSATVQEVSRNTSEAAEISQQAKQNVVQGNQTVSHTVKDIHTLESQLKQSTQQIAEVEEGVTNISSILDVIKGIADQTNLLALNAAIEAARAGEQGRGFAVVADEVRTLAQNTQDSTEEIESMMIKLQESAKKAVSAMQQGQESTEKVVTQAEVAGESLNNIQTAMQQITDMVAQIAQATQEQASVTDEVNQKILDIKSISEQSGDAAQQVHAASKELAQSSHALQEMVAHFKL